MLRLSEYLRSVTDPSGGVILDIRRGQIFRCNATGAIILELLTHGFDQAQLECEFSKLCGLSPGSAKEDVREFLTTLRQFHLLDDRLPVNTR